MSRLTGFVLRLGKDLCQAKREQIATMFGIYDISADKSTGVSPARSIESIK